MKIKFRKAKKADVAGDAIVFVPETVLEGYHLGRILGAKHAGQVQSLESGGELLSVEILTCQLLNWIR